MMNGNEEHDPICQYPGKGCPWSDFLRENLRSVGREDYIIKVLIEPPCQHCKWFKIEE